jgi:hypothetical protein
MADVRARTNGAPTAPRSRPDDKKGIRSFFRMFRLLLPGKRKKAKKEDPNIYPIF